MDKPVEPPTRQSFPEPVERTYDKAPAASQPASSAPVEGPRDVPAAAAGSAPLTDGAAPSSPEALQPQAPRPAIDLHGLRQYHLALGRMAARFKRYPVQAREGGWEGRVALRLGISETGTPLGIVVIGSSGIQVLDQAALEMLRLAASHTPVPESLLGRAFTIDLAVDYNLKDEQ
jgi:protein TonB